VNKDLNNFTIWITGLSASGKTTLGLLLKKKLLDYGLNNVVFLDGDILRDKLKIYEYDENNRKIVGNLKAKIAKEENKKGNIVIVTGIASKKIWREEYRKIIDNYYEVYLKCSLETCVNRDYKNQYSKAILGEINNFSGVSDNYEEHKSVDLILDTNKYKEEECLVKLFNFTKTIIKD